MTYELVIGDRPHSSWSLRAWLLFEHYGIPAKTRLIDFSGDDVAKQLADYAPAQTVPTVRTEEGAILSDSLAIAEELATRHPDAGIWPDKPLARATARTLAAEMHSGFSALREACPMNLRVAYANFAPDADVRRDIGRIEEIWAHARASCKPSGPWLCDDYSAADAFFAPVAARIAGYGLAVGDAAQAYVKAHLSDPAFRRWRAMGFAKGAHLPWYAMDLETRSWPGPAPLVARTTEAKDAENETCPYSGKPVTHFLEIDGRIFGFCNAFCRDKTVHDPEAWPAFMEIYGS